MFSAIIAFSKTPEIKAIETVLKLLASYHGMHLDNEQFVRQYRHLIAMYRTLCKETKIKPTLYEDIYHVS